jgi:NAD(P)-dependent dehydrogenase (short-subunit alcohol dehydrogenase family)
VVDEEDGRLTRPGHPETWPSPTEARRQYTLGDVTNAYRRVVFAEGVTNDGQPADVAHAVLLLASAQSAYITGVEIAVDGGLAQIGGSGSATSE